MNTEDTRWKQRFSNYKTALMQLNNAVELNQQRLSIKLKVNLNIAF